MTVPTLTVELATSGGPYTASPSWTTVPAADVLAFGMVEGRTSPTADATAPSTATVTFDNSRREYDPSYTSGTYYGDLLPGRQIRVTAVEADTTETVLFRGVVNVEGWQQRDYQHPNTSKAVVSCVDWLGALASAPSDLPAFESYLRQLAVDAGLWDDGTPRVLHWPLDDASGWSGEQTFDHPIDNADVYSPYGVYYWRTRLDWAEYVPASTVHSDVALRATLAGSLDTGLGAASIWFDDCCRFSSSTDTTYPASATFGFAIRLNSHATFDGSPLITNVASGNGYYLDRDGGLYVVYDEAGTKVSTDVSSSYRLEIGVTYFICSTYTAGAGSSGVVRLYVNGIEQASDLYYPSTGTTSSVYQMAVGGIDTYAEIDSTPYANICDFFCIADVLTATEIGNVYDLWKGYDGVLTGDAAGTLLTSLAIPHNVAGGRVGLGEQSTASPAGMLQSIERTERGRLYANHRTEQVELLTLEDLATATRQTVPQVTLSDTAADTGAGYLRYGVPSFVNLQAVNAATASNEGATWTVRDEESIQAFGVQPKSFALVSGSDVDPLAVAQWETALHPEPSTAVSAIRIQPTTAQEFSDLLDVRLFDLATLKRLPHNLGTTLTTSVVVEGRSVSVGDGVAGWQVELFLRDYDNWPWWLWADGEFATLGAIGDPDANGKRLAP